MNPIVINVPPGFYITYVDGDGPALGGGYHFVTRSAAEIYMNDWLAQHPNPQQKPMHVIEVK